MKEPKIYLLHILEAILRIEEYALGMNEAQFLKDHKTQDAIIRQLEIIGEASRQLEESFKQEYPKLPWKHMVSMRNKLMHEYFGISIKIIWETIHTDLPPLKQKISEITSRP